MTQPCTILRAGVALDRYGNATRDWSAPTVRKASAWIAQRSADEMLNSREGEISTWVGSFGPGVDIAPEDRVVRYGETFEVSGPVNPAYTPAGLHHLEVPLKIVAG